MGATLRRIIEVEEKELEATASLCSELNPPEPQMKTQ